MGDSDHRPDRGPSRRRSVQGPSTNGKARCRPIWTSCCWYKCYIKDVRFEFERSKSRDVKRKHGVSLKEAREIFDQAYLVDQKNDDPEQFRAIGWCGGRLCSVVFEIRHDADGEYYHLVTAWRATQEEEQSYAENV